MPTAYSFLRLSSSAPARRDALVRAPAAQAWCIAHHLDLDHSVPHQGAAVSPRGPGHETESRLGDFLARVHAGDVAKGSFLLLEQLDADARANAAAVANLFRRIVESGVTVVALGEGTEYTKAVVKHDANALLFMVAGLVRVHEDSTARSLRTRASWAARRERAQAKERISAICPAWLALDRDTGTFRVNRERARIVQRIYADTLRGAGQEQIATALNHEGIPVFGRGRHWQRSYVLKVLRSAAVVGTFTPHTVEEVDGRRVRKPAGAPISNYYPRIIDPDEFMQVQTLVRDSRSPLRGRHAKSGQVANIFGGLTHCGRCGAPVTLVSKGKAPKVVRYLVCSAARVRSGCRRYEAIPYARFERALLRNRERLLSRARAGERRADLDRLIVEAEAAAYRVGDTLEGLMARADHGVRTTSVQNRIRKLGAERDKLLVVADSIRVERETTTRAYVRDRVHELQEALDGEPLDRTRVNALLRQVFSSVTVDYDGADLAFLWRHGGQTEIDLGS